MSDVEKTAWVERVLGVKSGGTGEDEEPELDVEGETAELKAMGLEVSDIWLSAVEAFEAATEDANGQIRELQAVLWQTDDLDLHDIADRGLNAMTENTRVPLMAAILDAGSGSPVMLKKAAPKILAAVQAFRTQLASVQVSVCDNNPFGVQMTFEDTYSGALDQLAHAAKLAA